ncbi:hypothetical protein HYR99_20650 [Candidatus Poribacteria bacterium]|nr:hypothetical protein [Candidatus Poribacteria bacterium]
MIDIDSRLRVARGIAKTETHASAQVFETLKRRGHPHAPPPVVSDGWGGIDEAMVAVYGQVPEYSGRGRPPTRKRPQPGWQYLQWVKQRAAKRGRVIGTRLQVIYGDETEGINLLGQSTADGERTHLTMRHFNTTRFAASSNGGVFKAQHHAPSSGCLGSSGLQLDSSAQNLTHKDQTDSPRRWHPRTPAMAAGLTDPLWTFKELLTTVPLPWVHTPENRETLRAEAHF